ncbi:MAG: hypothetical protein HQL75_08780 [Magnetococcales bacterium]|nr:hypothetical protein [Magnetococcales bacterium]
MKELNCNNFVTISLCCALSFLSLYKDALAASLSHESTGALVEACKQKDGVGAGYCRGMIIGVSVILSANSELPNRPPFYACLNKNMSTGMIIQDLIDWSRLNQKIMPEAAPIGLVQYFMDRHRSKCP